MNGTLIFFTITFLILVSFRSELYANVIRKDSVNKILLMRVLNSFVVNDAISKPNTADVGAEWQTSTLSGECENEKVLCDRRQRSRLSCRAILVFKSNFNCQ